MTNDSPNMVEIIPETVGQYTGLDDKNGVKIFEGDVVRSNDTAIGHVIYEESGTAFELLFYDDTDCFGLGQCYISEELEVIGNIHDNPELLKIS